MFNILFFYTMEHVVASTNYWMYGTRTRSFISFMYTFGGKIE